MLDRRELMKCSGMAALVSGFDLSRARALDSVTLPFDNGERPLVKYPQKRPMIRLTSLAHGGGCGCKLAPSVLQELLADQPMAAPFKQLLVGTETSDERVGADPVWVPAAQRLHDRL